MADGGGGVAGPADPPAAPDEVDPHRLTDAEILRAVETTIRQVLLPALRDEADWARAAAVQLAGLARYAAHRGPDRAMARHGELSDALEGLAGNGIVAARWAGDRSPTAVLEAVGASLASAVGRDDPDAAEVRAVLRPIVVRQLDDELAQTAPLVDAFRGRLDD